MAIYEFLSKGAGNARTGKELCVILNLSMRELRAQIAAERQAGIPILSRTRTDADGKAGYFLPEKLGDYAATLRAMKAREKSLAAVRKALENALEAGQTA